MKNFSKRHYVIVAEAINQELKQAIVFDEAITKNGITSNTLQGVRAVMFALTDKFKRDNNKFNFEKFIDKCYEGINQKEG